MHSPVLVLILFALGLMTIYLAIDANISGVFSLFVGPCFVWFVVSLALCLCVCKHFDQVVSRVCMFQLLNM